MLFKKEKKVIEVILKHLDLVVDSLKTGIQTAECYLSNDIGEAKRLARKVRSIESEADLVRHDVSHNTDELWVKRMCVFVARSRLVVALFIFLYHECVFPL